MKFKKFLMTLACMVLVICATLGFAGCAKEVSAEEVKTFMQAAEVDGVFDNGYKLKMKGLFVGEMEVEVLFDDAGELTAAYYNTGDVLGLGEVWLKDGYVYVKNEDSKVKYAYNDLSSYNTIKSALNTLKNKDDDYDLESLLEGLEEYDGQADVKVSLKKDVAGSKTTFIMKASGKSMGISFTAENKIVFDGNKLVKITSNSKLGKETAMEILMETYNGNINLPADADSYTPAA